VSIFGNIMSKILGHSRPSGSPTTQAPAQAGPGSTQSAQNTAPTGGSSSDVGRNAGSAPSPAEAPKATVDVTTVLDGLAAKNQQKLDWRHSIVDMMKLLGLDSGLSARKELAEELHYSGDTNDSALMNIWLHKQVMHKQVMQKLAENGGKVPDELRH
jgi:hypothetical protein